MYVRESIDIKKIMNAKISLQTSVSYDIVLDVQFCNNLIYKLIL